MAAIIVIVIIILIMEIAIVMRSLEGLDKSSAQLAESPLGFWRF